MNFAGDSRGRFERAARQSWRFLVLAAALGGCPPQITTGVERAAIISGEPAPSDTAVVGLAHQPAGEPFCTGTLVSAHVVVTAAHCVAQAGPVTVFFEQAGVRTDVSAASVEVRPDFTVAPLVSDLALLVLAEAAPAFADPIAPWPTPPLVDEAARFVGYGYSEIGARGVYGTRLTRAALITGIQDATFSYGVATCEGDSGGPALVWRNGTEVLVGLTSNGDATCGVYGVDTRVDRYSAWIAAAVARADPQPPSTGCSAAPLGATRSGRSALTPLAALVFWYRARRRS